MYQARKTSSRSVVCCCCCTATDGRRPRASNVRFLWGAWCVLRRRDRMEMEGENARSPLSLSVRSELIRESERRHTTDLCVLRACYFRAVCRNCKWSEILVHSLADNVMITSIDTKNGISFTLIYIISILRVIWLVEVKMYKETIFVGSLNYDPNEDHTKMKNAAPRNVLCWLWK